VAHNHAGAIAAWSRVAGESSRGNIYIAPVGQRWRRSGTNITREVVVNVQVSVAVRSRQRG